MAQKRRKRRRELRLQEHTSLLRSVRCRDSEDPSSLLTLSFSLRTQIHHTGSKRQKAAAPHTLPDYLSAEQGVRLSAMFCFFRSDGTTYLMDVCVSQRVQQRALEVQKSVREEQRASKEMKKEKEAYKQLSSPQEVKEESS